MSMFRELSNKTRRSIAWSYVRICGRSQVLRAFAFLTVTYVLYLYQAYCSRPIIGYELRLLAIGDSITWGFGSSDWNSFRGPLLGELIGNVAYFIGSQQTGDMFYNYHEGRPGQRLNTTLENVAWALTNRPNIVLVHLGSNDIVFSDNTETAPQRMDQIFEGIWQFCPDATLLIARIGPINQTVFVDQYEDFNNNVAVIVEAHKHTGGHILMVDLTRGLDLTKHFVDNTHPNDEGYKIMARSWYIGILEAKRRGWLRNPIPIEELHNIRYIDDQGIVELHSVGSVPEVIGSKPGIFQPEPEQHQEHEDDTMEWLEQQHEEIKKVERQVQYFVDNAPYSIH